MFVIVARVDCDSPSIPVLVVTIGVAVQDRPADAPPTGPWEKDLQIFGKPSFLAAMSAVAQLVTAFAGAPAL